MAAGFATLFCYMETEEFFKGLKEIVNNWDNVVDTIIDSLLGDMVNMERDRLFTGVNADGTEINPPYTPFTVMVKSEKGQPTDRVTLFDTGAFYDSLFAERNGGEIIFDATDEKRDKLVRKYGDVFGLSDTQIDILRESVNERMSEYILSKLN